MSVENDSSYCIGIDLGGTKLLLLITTLSGDIVYETKTLPYNEVPEIANLVKGSIAAAGLTSGDITGLGIGVPGTVKNRSFVIQASPLGWYNFDLGEALRNEFPFPVYVGNDVNLAALGEQWKGSGEQSPNIFFIAIGTGVGGAVIAGGKLIEGHNYRCGEVGYFIERKDFENGVYNHQREQGILEKKISGTALNKHGFTAEELFIRCSRGDKQAIAIINDFIADMAVMIANCVSLLDPERVILGGGVSNSLAPFLPKISELVDRLTATKTTIAITTLGTKAGAFGAVALMLNAKNEPNMERSFMPDYMEQN
jgi:glucokinase